MSSSSSRIHPTAIISAEAEIAEDVVIGPYVVIEGKVRVGAGCVIRPYVHLCGPLTMGCRNMVFGGAVLGERPQHTKYNDEPTSVEIGDDNVFREQVTVHRGTTQAWTTRIGNGNFFMANSHVAHDCVVGNNCILANGALIGGHGHLHDNVYLSGNSAVHQFVRMGRLALVSGTSATTKDVPPFIVIQGVNVVCGVNVVGMRRAGLSHAQIDAVRRAYSLLYRENNLISVALEKISRELGEFPAAVEMVEFIRGTKRGICLGNEHTREAA
jgi:UDP-N-acetylglucosamine acyltransferase